VAVPVPALVEEADELPEPGGESRLAHQPGETWKPQCQPLVGRWNGRA
jgi:hypothetical protein